MEKTTTLESVRTSETRGGNTRYVVRDAEGNEYTTFPEHIGERARQLQGTVRITYRGSVARWRKPASPRS